MIGGRLEMIDSGLGRKMRLRMFDDKGDVNRKLGLMANVVEKEVLNPQFHTIALSAVENCPDKDDECEINAIFDFVKNNVRYVADIRGIETFRRPLRTLELGQGDCDDMVMLVVALALSVGFAAGGEVIATEPENDWSHIYAIVGVPKHAPTKWIPLDPTEDVRPGWRPTGSKVKKRFQFEVLLGDEA